MTKKEIIEVMGRNKMVETIIADMTHSHPDYDLQDLSQMIYEALLIQPEERIQDLWNNNEMQYFIIGIIKRQLFSQTSPYYLTIRKFRDITDDVDDCYDIDGTLRQNYDREKSCE